MTTRFETFMALCIWIIVFREEMLQFREICTSALEMRAAWSPEWCNSFTYFKSVISVIISSMETPLLARES
jgi:hypothetical protein